MNSRELRAERIRQGRSMLEMASVIGKSMDAYSKKERGEVKFSPDEMAAIQVYLHLSEQRFNDIFFDGNLLFGKFIHVGTRKDSVL